MKYTLPLRNLDRANGNETVPVSLLCNDRQLGSEMQSPFGTLGLVVRNHVTFLPMLFVITAERIVWLLEKSRSRS